jgi:hypothetical protein
MDTGNLDSWLQVFDPRHVIRCFLQHIDVKPNRPEITFEIIRGDLGVTDEVLRCDPTWYGPDRSCGVRLKLDRDGVMLPSDYNITIDDGNDDEGILRLVCSTSVVDLDIEYHVQQYYKAQLMFTVTSERGIENILSTVKNTLSNVEYGVVPDNKVYATTWIFPPFSNSEQWCDSILRLL